MEAAAALGARAGSAQQGEDQQGQEVNVLMESADEDGLSEGVTRGEAGGGAAERRGRDAAEAR